LAFTGASLSTFLMPVFPRLILPVLIGLTAAPVQAAEPAHHACLNKAEQRAAVASHRAVSLGKAMASARRHRKVEVLRARLCHRGDGLVYELTLLAHNGKVIRATVDAANGELIKSR
jgi:uncharacterized membrane protein YkoI